MGWILRLIGLSGSGLMAVIGSIASALVWAWWRNAQLSTARQQARSDRAYRDTRRRIDDAVSGNPGVDDREWLRRRGAGQR